MISGASSFCPMRRSSAIMQRTCGTEPHSAFERLQIKAGTHPEKRLRPDFVSVYLVVEESQPCDLEDEEVVLVCAGGPLRLHRLDRR